MTSRLLSFVIVSACLVLAAGSAHAIKLTLYTPSLVFVDDDFGSTFEVQLYLDTEGEANITSVFASVQVVGPTADSAIFTFGTSPPTILTNLTSGNFESLTRTSQPVDGIPGDAIGRVRAANFAAPLALPNGTGAAYSNQLLATLTFTNISYFNFVQLAPILGPGDEITVNGIDVSDTVTFAVVVVPEPGTMLLVALGLGGLGWVGRRRS